MQGEFYMNTKFLREILKKACRKEKISILSDGHNSPDTFLTY